MFGVPVLALIALAVTAVSWAVSRYGFAGRLGRLYAQAYRDWEAGDLDAAYRGYQQLHQRSKRIRDRPTQAAYEFICLQALGALDRSRNQFPDAVTKLSRALDLVDDEVDQTSEVVLVTCIELCFALASLGKSEESGAVALRIEEELDAMQPEDQSAVCRELLPHLAAVAGEPLLYHIASLILSRMAARVDAMIDLEPTAEPTASVNSKDSRPIASTSGVKPGVNAFRPAAEIAINDELSRVQGLWIECMLERANLAESGSEHATALRLLDEIQGNPLWWKLDQRQTARGDELRARSELYCGSVIKAAEMGTSVYETRVRNDDDPFVLSATEVGLSSFLRARGEYEQSFEHAKSAYQRVCSAARNPYHVSSWYPSLYALALIEIGRYDEAWPMLDRSLGQRSHDATPVSDSYTLMLHAIYLRGLGSLDLSEARMRESLRMVSAAYGEYSHHCFDHRIVLAGILLLQERLDDAERELNLVETGMRDREMRSTYSLSHFTLVSIALDIQRGHLGIAEQRLVAIQRDLRKELLSHHHIFVDIQHLMGAIHQAVGDGSAAIEALEESRRLRALTQRENAPDFHGTLVTLIELYRSVGETTAESELRVQLSAVEAYRDKCHGIANGNY